MQREDVSPIELFFDLVFVFAISQLAHHLHDHLSWVGAGQTAVLLVAVFGVWSYTTFEATLVRVSRMRTQLVLLVVMLFDLFMNAAITDAFGRGSWAFVVPFLIVQLGRPVWTTATAPSELREHYIVMMIWLVASAPLWIIGAAVDPSARLAWWAVAAVMDLTGTWLAHPLPGRVLRSEEIEFDAPHLIERCRLFLIIALGESVLAAGGAIAAAPNTLSTWFTGTCGFVAVVALWALYFAGSDDLVQEHVETTANPILAGRLTLTGESVVVAGLIALAVGTELAIGRPHETTTAAMSLLLFGGPVLYLMLQTGYMRLVLGEPNWTRPIGIGVLIVAGFVSSALSVSVALCLLAVILTGLALAAVREDRLKSADRATVPRLTAD